VISNVEAVEKPHFTRPAAQKNGADLTAPFSFPHPKSFTRRLVSADFSRTARPTASTGSLIASAYKD
jgi:hypothetical protein